MLLSLILILMVYTKSNRSLHNIYLNLIYDKNQQFSHYQQKVVLQKHQYVGPYMQFNQYLKQISFYKISMSLINVQYNQGLIKYSINKHFQQPKFEVKRQYITIHLKLVFLLNLYFLTYYLLGKHKLYLMIVQRHLRQLKLSQLKHLTYFFSLVKKKF